MSKYAEAALQLFTLVWQGTANQDANGEDYEHCLHLVFFPHRSLLQNLCTDYIWEIYSTGQQSHLTCVMDFCASSVVLNYLFVSYPISGTCDLAVNKVIES